MSALEKTKSLVKIEGPLSDLVKSVSRLYLASYEVLSVQKLLAGTKIKVRLNASRSCRESTDFYWLLRFESNKDTISIELSSAISKLYKFSPLLPIVSDDCFIEITADKIVCCGGEFRNYNKACLIKVK